LANISYGNDANFYTYDIMMDNFNIVNICEGKVTNNVDIDESIV
jgi:hypothetical protein